MLEAGSTLSIKDLDTNEGASAVDAADDCNGEVLVDADAAGADVDVDSDADGRE